MKLYIMVALCAMMAVAACNSTKPVTTQNKITPTDKLLGKKPVSALEKAPFNEWYSKEYNGYTPDTATIELLKPLLASKQITVFLGTWCGDSRREVPRFIHVLTAAGFPEKRLTIITVDNTAEAYKQSPGHEEAGLNIFRVPTFVVNSNGKEAGRIIEAPVQSLEKDLLAIVQGTAYTPRYAAGQYFMDRLPHSPLGQFNFPAGLKTSGASELNSIGLVLKAAGKPDQAMVAFRTNAVHYPQDAAILASLASGNLAVKDTGSARANLLRALELDPANEAALKLQAIIGK